jgi:putative tricarboxylic transport membrane protein
MSMHLPDRLTGIGVAGLGALAVYGGSQLPPMPGQDVGPSAFPILIGLALVISGTLITAGIGRRFEEEAEASVAPMEDAVVLPASSAALPSWLRLVVAPTLLLFYVAAADTLGFVPTAGLVVVTASLVMGATLRLALPLAVLAPLAVHLVFSKLLRVALPPGLLPMPW